MKATELPNGCQFVDSGDSNSIGFKINDRMYFDNGNSKDCKQCIFDYEIKQECIFLSKEELLKRIASYPSVQQLLKFLLPEVFQTEFDLSKFEGLRATMKVLQKMGINGSTFTINGNGFYLDPDLNWSIETVNGTLTVVPRKR